MSQAERLSSYNHHPKATEDIAELFSSLPHEAFVDQGVQLLRWTGNNGGTVYNPQADSLVAEALDLALEGEIAPYDPNLPSHDAQLAIGLLREYLIDPELCVLPGLPNQTDFGRLYLEELRHRFVAAQNIDQAN